MIALAGMFYLLSLPQLHLSLGAGYVQMRLSGFLPMTAGLLFGPIGAIGCALGNFLNDLSGTLEIADLFGSLGVFLMGWLPYKLWHSLFLTKDRQPEFLESAGSVVKFTLIAAVSSVCAAAMGSLGGEITHTYRFGEFFLQVMLQYFDLTMMLGLLIVHLGMQRARIVPAIPKRAYQRSYASARYLLDYALIAVVAALTLIMLFGARIDDTQALCWALLSAIALLALLPLTRGEAARTKEGKTYQPVSGLQGQIITVFALMICAVLLLYAAVSSWLVYGNMRIVIGSMDVSMIQKVEILKMWVRIFVSMAAEAVALIGVLTLLLRWVNRRLVRPLKRTSDYASRFAAGDRLVAEKLHLAHTGNEIDALGQSINHMVEDIHSYTEEIRRKAQAEQKLAVEMNAARDIQMGMLPAKWTGSGFGLAASIHTARQVGGDFYGFQQLRDDAVFAAVADVTGKGVSAALFMACACTLMEARLHLPLAEMMRQVNEELAKKNDALMFVTMFACVLDKAEGVLHYVNAGHNPPVIYANGCAELLKDDPDFVLGPMPGAQYEEKTLPLTEDFALLLYTDGVVEAENSAQEFFGTKRLLTRVQAMFECQSTAEQVIGSVEQAVEEFAAGAEQSDDITLLCVIPNGETKDV